MAKTIPTAFDTALVNPADLMTGRFIRAEVYQDIAEHQHYMYVHSGFRIPGIQFVDAPCTTTSTSYTTANSGAGRDLDTWGAHAYGKRPLNYGGTIGVRWIMKAYGQDFQIRATLLDADDGSTIRTVFTGTSSTTPIWTTNIGTLTSGDFYVGGSTSNALRDLQIYVEFRAVDTEAKLWAFDFHEYVLTSPWRLPDNGT